MSEAELAQVEAQAPRLQTVLQSCTGDVQKLIRSPFNLRLVAELIAGGETSESLASVRTQIQLLERYWDYRVIQNDGRGDAREAVLQAVVDAMVATRSLQAQRQPVAANPAMAEPLGQLLSANVLIEFQRQPDEQADRYTLTFPHNILFDYAAARLLFRGNDAVTMRRLESDPDTFIALRPSVGMHVHYLWGIDATHGRFWRFVFDSISSDKIPQIGKILGPIAAADLIEEPRDYAVLIEALQNEKSADHKTAIEAFRHLTGAVRANPRPIVGGDSPPWAQLLQAVAEA